MEGVKTKKRAANGSPFYLLLCLVGLRGETSNPEELAEQLFQELLIWNNELSLLEHPLHSMKETEARP